MPVHCQQSIKELDYYKTNAAKIDNYLEKTKEIGLMLIKKSVPVAIKLITAGLVDIDQTMKDSISELAEDFAKDQIEHYKSAKNCITNFREQLRDTVEAINETEEKKRPLIIFIDELDRCRPDFAIEILEKVKHFFNVPNIIFILALDKNQLGYSIQSIYSVKMDVDGYLRRFFDLEFVLPYPSEGNYAEYLYNKFELDGYFSKKEFFSLPDESIFFKEQLNKLFYVFDLSLRQQEQIFTQICLALRMTPVKYFTYSEILSTFIIINNLDKGLYTNFFKTLNADEIIDYIEGQPRSLELFKYNFYTEFKAKIIWFSFTDDNYKTHYERSFAISQNASASELERNNAKFMMDRWSHWGNNKPEIIRQNLKNKIELLANFIE